MKIAIGRRGCIEREEKMQEKNEYNKENKEVEDEQPLYLGQILICNLLSHLTYTPGGIQATVDLPSMCSKVASNCPPVIPVFNTEVWFFSACQYGAAS